MSGDPFERRIESALRPGTFIRYGESFSFVKALDKLAGEIENGIDEDPDRAASVLEAFLAGCYAKTEELDDSGGELGNFMQRLCCLWVRARQSGGCPPSETVRTLVRWMDRDDYGYTYRIERDLADALDGAGRNAFVELARSRFDEASLEAVRRKDELGGDASKRHWADVLRALFRAQRDAFSYIRLCQRMGMRGEDCVVIADLFDAAGDTAQALSWVRRGLECREPRDFATHDLEKRERALLSKLGRPDEALDLAWKHFDESPHNFSYGELMRYAPDAEQPLWHERAMERATRGDLRNAMELYVETHETARLVDAIRQATNEALIEVGDYVLGDAATHLKPSHPGVAARLFRAIGLSIVDEGRSKRYPTALSNLERAKTCYENAGLGEEWNALVEDIRRRHGRKTSFMPRFEKIVQDVPHEEPSFLDDAKKRWAGQRPRGPASES